MSDQSLINRRDFVKTAGGAVAAERGDAVVPIERTAPDRVHPRSYSILWRSVARALEVLS